MINSFPIAIRCHNNEFIAEFCLGGVIPDVFRQLRFGPPTEFELPDTKRSDNDFLNWLSLYRRATPGFESKLLEETYV